MASLDIMQSSHRLSCVGIAYGLYGMSSLHRIIETADLQGDNSAKHLHSMFRQVYHRLILPLDALVCHMDEQGVSDMAAFGEDLAKLPFMTREVEILVDSLKSSFPP